MNILPSILRKLRYKPYHMFCSVKLLLLLLLSYFTPFLRGFCDPAFQGLYAYQVCGCHADTNLKLKILFSIFLLKSKSIIPQLNCKYHPDRWSRILTHFLNSSLLLKKRNPIAKNLFISIKSFCIFFHKDLVNSFLAVRLQIRFFF